VLAAKNNQPRLFEDVVASFHDAFVPSGAVLHVGRDCDRKMLRTVLAAVLRNKTEAPAC
jgi:hypothetical protein